MKAYSEFRKQNPDTQLSPIEYMQRTGVKPETPTTVQEVKSVVETPVATEASPPIKTPSILQQARKTATRNKAKKLVSDIQTKIEEAPVREIVPATETVTPTETFVERAYKA